MTGKARAAIGAAHGGQQMPVTYWRMKLRCVCGDCRYHGFALASSVCACVVFIPIRDSNSRPHENEDFIIIAAPGDTKVLYGGENFEGEKEGEGGGGGLDMGR